LHTWDLPAAGAVDRALFFPVASAAKAVQKALTLAGREG